MINELKNILLDTRYFNDNEYLTAYLSLVDNYSTNAPGYSEKHHVIPAAVYKHYYNCKNVADARKMADTDEKNYTVSLLYKDHVLAHYFLYFCTKGSVKKAMGKAIICMVGNLKIDKLDLSEFRYLPEQFDKIQQLIDHIYADPSNNFYTPCEVEFLKTYYSEKGPQWCAEQLKKQLSSVRAKAHSLRLHHNTPQPWSAEEIVILKQYYENNGPKYCKTLLPNRTESAISSMARTLGLATGRFWTEEEIKFLMDNYSIAGGKKCAELLNRPHSVVRAKAAALKLSAPGTWQETELSILLKYYATEGVDYCTKLLNRKPQDIRVKACKLGLTVQRRDWLQEEIDFLKQHYERFGTKFCAEALPGRTRGAVAQQAKKLGLNAGWSDEEETFLIENYTKFGCKKCAEDLDKNFEVVYAKASALKLKAPKPNAWTAVEIDLLVKHYKTDGIAYCVDLLKRERGAIISKAYKLGLTNKHKD